MKDWTPGQKLAAVLIREKRENPPMVDEDGLWHELQLIFSEGGTYPDKEAGLAAIKSKTYAKLCCVGSLMRLEQTRCSGPCK